MIAFFRSLRRGDIAAVLTALAIVGSVALAFVFYPNTRQSVNAGFGPDWNCSYPGKGDPVCVKKVSGNPDAPQPLASPSR